VEHLDVVALGVQADGLEAALAPADLDGVPVLAQERDLLAAQLLPLVASAVPIPLLGECVGCKQSPAQHCCGKRYCCILPCHWSFSVKGRTGDRLGSCMPVGLERGVAPALFPLQGRPVRARKARKPVTLRRREPPCPRSRFCCCPATASGPR